MCVRGDGQVVDVCAIGNLEGSLWVGEGCDGMVRYGGTGLVTSVCGFVTLLCGVAVAFVG